MLLNLRPLRRIELSTKVRIALHTRATGGSLMRDLNVLNSIILGKIIEEQSMYVVLSEGKTRHQM